MAAAGAHMSMTKMRGKILPRKAMSPKGGEKETNVIYWHVR